MFTVKWLNGRPEEITIDNYDHQAVRIYDGSTIVTTVTEKEQLLDSAKAFFNGQIELGLSLILSIRIIHGQNAENIVKHYNLPTLFEID